MAVKKIQVFLREDQQTALKSVSARMGLRQSDLVRQGVDLLLEGASRRTADWRNLTCAAAGLWRERKDLDATNEELRASARRRFPAAYPNWRSFVGEPCAEADFLSERRDLIEEGRAPLIAGKPNR
jgi:hypothetical protein